MQYVLKMVIGCLLVFAVGSFTTSAVVVLDTNGADVVDDLQALSLAIYNYHDANNQLPSNINNGAGAPLLSWRVALLPYLGETALFNQFDLTKAWNETPNLELLDHMPDVLRGPFDGPDSIHTHYARGSGPGSLLEDGAVIRLSNITDGTSNTLLLGEAAETEIPWSAPLDLSIVPCPDLPALGDLDFFSSDISNLVPFAFADGSVRFLEKDIDCDTLHSLFIRNDGGPLSFESHDYVIAASVPESGVGAKELGFAMLLIILASRTIPQNP